VATRVTRERAHRFYLREGFALDKTSHIFERPITEATRARTGRRA
jgi:hypothetical protein